MADNVELLKAAGCPSCNNAHPKPVPLASTYNIHGLFTSKNFNVVAFAMTRFASLEALSCHEDHDQTALTCVSCVSGFPISERFGVNRDK